MKDQPRLSASTVGQARISPPDYDRSAKAAIVHLGVGAFAQGHLGVFADDLCRSGWPATIRGVSLRGAGAEERLGPQDGWYSVTDREPGEDGPVRLVGALTSVGTGPALAVDAIASPHTRLVTLTVTERGYDLDAEEMIVGPPRSPAAVVAASLDRRRSTGAPGLVVASLDNVLDNGTVLREAVLEVAARIDPTLQRWIDGEVCFPSSVVDRMVPATTADDLAEVGDRLGLVDLGAVTAEHYRSWVIEAVEGLPPLADVGVEVVGDLSSYQRRKLWLLNGPHSAVAYGGLIVGCATIAEAVEHPLVALFVQSLVQDILEVAELPAAVAAPKFAADTIDRFRNPSLGHTCAQVGADGSRKLPQRLLPVVAERRVRGLATDRFAVVVAAWLAAVAGIAVCGSRLPPVDDPLAAALRSAGNDARRAVTIGLSGFDDAGFAEDVATMLERLIGEGSAVLESRS